VKALANPKSSSFLQLGIACAVDLAHAARPDGREDFIRPEFVTGLERHMTDLA
jgi:hypothetical protein